MPAGPRSTTTGISATFRTFLEIDVLRRFLKLTGMPLRHVMNITDVDDKIIRNAAAAGVPIGEYTPKYVDAFFEDLDALGVERPEIIARATENIDRMVELIREAGRGRRGVPDRGWIVVLPAAGRFPSTAS